ncbi:MAG: hypothetical protein HYX94_00185 [Chloroflexi bacterium]|nr:hypothetical protein [Chloroflexota bacterium]
MTLPRLDHKTTVLLILVVVLVLGDSWYGQDTWKAHGQAESLQEETLKAQRELRTRQSTAQLANIKKELEELQKKAPATIQQPLPASADAERLNREVEQLLFNPQVVKYSPKESKTETIDGGPVQILGYELSLQGNERDLLSMLRRIDESNLASLKIQTFSIERQKDNWLMKLSLSLYLVAPPPPPSATPTPKSG